MIDFDEIPNKKLGTDASDCWPALGNSFPLNLFYRQFDGAEGWIGDSYFAMWSRKEISEFRGPNLEAFPSKYNFFGSDGGGTQFGFFVTDDGIQFCSAPDIGGEEDIRVLGDWNAFVSSIRHSDYI